MSTIDEARQLFARGDIAGAREACLAALAASSPATEAAAMHALLAACFRSEGNGAAGLAHAREAVAIRPDDAGSLYALAECLDDTGDKAGAIASLRRALAARSHFVQAHRYLGLLLADTHDVRGAAASFARAVELDPRHARTWCNLGSAQQTQGLLQDALASFRRALAVQPDYPIAECNLAIVLRDLGCAEEAESVLRRGLGRQPRDKPLRAAIVVLAGLLQVRGELDEAAKLYRRAIELAPGQSSSEHFNLGEVLATSGSERAANEAYATALRLRPGHLRAALGARLTLPMVYADAASVREARARYTAGLATLESEIDGVLSRSTPDQIVDGLRWSNFLLAYQCGDDRELQARYAALAARAIDTADASWRAPIRAEAVDARRIRVGFV
jgi:protein O-GlcNAc transferase